MMNEGDDRRIEEFHDELDKIRKHGMALQFAPENMKGNKEVVIKAVRQNGLALQYASEILRSDPDVLRAAVSNNSFAYEFVPKRLRSSLILQVRPL